MQNTKILYVFGLGKRKKKEFVISWEAESRLGSRERDTIIVKKRAANVWKLVRYSVHFNVHRTTCLCPFQGAGYFTTW